jgi:Domain of unknown function (DUF927)
MESLEQFFAHVLPSSGPYCITYMSPSMKGMRHIACRNFTEMRVQALAESKKSREVYFSIASFRQEQVINPRTKKKSIRIKENALYNRSFIIDVDVKDNSNFYKTKDEAADGIRNLVEKLGIPQPIVVDSGGGYHLYWPLEEELTSDLWVKAANTFKQAVRLAEPKIVADPTRVADCVGVLRVPETFNVKRHMPVELLFDSGNSTPVKVIVSQCIKYIEDNGQHVQEIAEKNNKKREENFLSLNVKHDFSVVAKRCKWTREYIKDRAKATEPQWYMMLGLAKHCEMEGVSTNELMHTLSKGHPGYSYEETEAKIRQVTAAQSGPSFCSTFRNNTPERCAGCPWASYVTTPARLPYVDLPAAAPIVEEKIIARDGSVITKEVELINPPKPYFRGKEGGIYINGEDEEGSTKTKRIYEYDIYPIARLEDEETGDQMLEIRVQLPIEGLRTIRIPTSCMVEPSAFAAQLAAKGVIVHKAEAPKLVGYLIEYAKAIQRQRGVQEEFTRFGWRGLDTSTPRFVMADCVMDHTGVIHPASLAARLQQFKPVMSTRGSLEQWKKGFSVYESMGADAFRYTLMLAFAAPLFALTPFHGLIFNLKGESGSGKSTALEIMTSVWGKPNAKTILTRDTQTTLPNKMGYLQSIPVTSDELTTINSDQLADLAYCISEGRGKDRADRSGNIRTNLVSWNTLLVGCSNNSLYEKLGMSRQGNNAHAYRIFEVHVPKAREQDKMIVDAASHILSMNYGHAGRVYIKRVITNLNEMYARVGHECQTIPTKYHMKTAERYWGVKLACIKVGGDVAKELGLHNYDVDKAIGWAVSNFTQVRDTVEKVEGDPISIMSDFMQINLRSTIHAVDGKVNTLGTNQMSPNSELHIRLEKSEGVYTKGYISQPAFKRYCNSNKVEYSWLVKRLTDAQLVTNPNYDKRLGDGIVTMLSPIMRCLEIDLRHPSILRIVKAKEEIETRLKEMAR